MGVQVHTIRRVDHRRAVRLKRLDRHMVHTMRERGRYRLVTRGDGRHVVARADGERDEVAVFEVAVAAAVVVEGGVEGGLLLGRKYRGKEEEEETRNQAC